MYPAYRYMDSSPRGPHPYWHERDSMPPPYYQHPSWEAVPPHIRIESPNTPYMRVESPKPPAAWGPGNYHGNASHHHTADCNGCCIHGYPHGQSSFRPPYPQPQPIPQSYYGPYGYHEPYPYFVFPTPYSVDQARYDYGKSRSHCCSCPNHSHMMGNGGVRVEEHNPDGEQQDDNATSIIRMPGSASPIVRVPSGNLKGKEEQKKPEAQSAVWFPNHPSQVMWVPSNFMGEEENKNTGAQPAVSNGWIPLDIGGLKELLRAANGNHSSADENKNKLETGSVEDLIRAANEKKNPPVEENKNKLDIESLKNLLRAANGKKNPSADEYKSKLDIEGLKELIRAINESKKPSAEESKNRFPWPLIWVPGDNETDRTKDVKENASPKAAEEVLPKLKIIPMKLLDERGEKPETEEQKGQGCQEKTNERETKTKTIPVKQLEENQKGPIANGKLQQKDNEQKDKTLDSNQGEDNKKNGQAKASKLPPVCLRVDPLPKEKNGNGKSRSPSPPSHKVEQQKSLRENKDETNAKEIRVVDMNKKVDHDVEKQKHKSQDVTVSVYAPAKADNQQESKEIDTKALDVQKEETKVEKTEEKRDFDESKISEKRSKVMSPIDAAVLIQSAYRGYEVRRWRPLEKLRKIAEIQRQANAITKQLQALEEASTVPDKKQIVVMNENIMRLLLQLDTIQGLQQDVREARKHVARELICLQEKLDAVSRQVSKEPEKTQATISDGSLTSDAPVSGITSSPEIVREDQERSMEQAPDSLKMEQKIVDSTSEGNAALEGQVEMTMHEVAVLAEDDGASSVAKEASGTSPLTSVEVHLSNDNKASGSLDQNDVSSMQAKSSDSDLSKAEELDLKDSASLQEQPPMIVNEQSDSDVARKSEPDMMMEEPVSDQNELDKVPEQVVHAEEAISENVASILEDDHQEKQDSNFRLGRAKTEPLVTDTRLNEPSEPTSPDDTAHATLPVVESEADTMVADSSDVLSTLAEPLPPAKEPNADTEVVSSAVEEPVLIEVSKVLPNYQFGNKESPHKENASLQANEIDTDVAVEEGGSMLVVEDSNLLDKPVLVQNADAPVIEATYSDAEIIKATQQENVEAMVHRDAAMSKEEFMDHNDNDKAMDNAAGIMKEEPVAHTGDILDSEGFTSPNKVEAMVHRDAAMTKEEFMDHNDNDEAMDNAAGILEEEPVAHTDDVMDSEGFTSPNEVENVLNTESVDQTTSLSTEEMKGTCPVEQTSGPSKEEMKLVEENEKLREMLERLLEAGKTQLGVIADLNDRVKDLEKKLSQKKRLRSKKQKLARSAACKVTL